MTLFTGEFELHGWSDNADCLEKVSSQSWGLEVGWKGRILSTNWMLCDETEWKQIFWCQDLNGNSPHSVYTSDKWHGITEEQPPARCQWKHFLLKAVLVQSQSEFILRVKESFFLRVPDRAAAAVWRAVSVVHEHTWFVSPMSRSTPRRGSQFDIVTK